MAAYETFAVGNIPGKPGSVTERGEFRGGGIRIDEIPNLPKVDPSMPKADYPDIGLTQRYEYQKPITGFEERAKALQQEPLPGGFARAAAKTSEVAGSGQEYMGRAISRGSANVSNALNSLSEVLSKVQRDASDSKDETDKIRYNSLEEVYKKKFEADMTQQKVPVQEWPERWKNDYDPQFQKDASGLGVYSGTRDRIQARASGFSAGMVWDSTLAGAKKQQADDIQVAKEAFSTGIEEKQFGRAAEANDTLLKNNYITKEQHDQNNWVLENAQNKNVLAETMTHENGPEYLLNQIDKLDKGQAADPEFDWLRNDPVSRAAAKREAIGLKNYREQEASKKFQDEVAAGTIKPENIEKEGAKRGIRASEVKSIKENAKAYDHPYDAKLVTKLNTRIADYNWETLPKEKETLATYYDLKNEIRKLPKDLQDEANQRLESRMEALKKGTGPTLDEQRKADIYKHIDRLDTGGYFGPTGEKLIEGKMQLPPNDPKALAQSQEHYHRIQAIKNEVDQLIKNDPNISLEKLESEVGKITQRYGVGALSTMKPWSPEDIRALKPPGTKDITTQTLAEEAAKKAQALKISPAAGVEVGVNYTVPLSSRGAASLGGGFAGKADVFNSAAQKHGVDARLLTAIAIHETGNGTSDILREKNNPGGLYDSKKGEYMSFPTLEAGIDAMAANLKHNYIDQGLTTIEAIGNKYAKPGENDPKGLNKDWVPGVKAQLQKLGGYSGGGMPTTSSVPGVNPALISRFNAVQQQFGEKLDIISGYRSVAYNEKVGGAKHSMHTHGNAIDIATGHLSHAQRLRLIEVAVQNGITGIGVYANNLHFDLGGKRAWGPPPAYSHTSLPDWARPTLRRLGYTA